MKTDKTSKAFSQKLRKNATKEENTLWYQYLRRYPVQFRRQCVFGSYIADFYCAKARLVVELDGSQHYAPTGMSYDEKRTQYLESLGLKVLRFSNADIAGNLRGVCQSIEQEIRERYRDEPLPEGVGRKAFSSYKK